MNANLVIISLLLAVFVLCLGAWVFQYLANNVLNANGKGAAKKTARELKNFSLIRGFKVLSNLELNWQGKTVHIENLLIGYFGILLVTTCGARGGFYGTLDGNSWVLAQGESAEGGGGKRREIQNPCKEQVQILAMLREILSKKKIYNLPMEHIVYFSNRSRKTTVSITHNGELLLSGKLKGYLGKTKFERDIGIDIAEVAAAITAHAGTAE